MAGLGSVGTALFAMTLTGCLMGESEHIPARHQLTQPITDGTLADEDPGVVGLMNGNSMYCTGTLISARVVLTAGHCIDEAVPQRVFFGHAIDLGGTFVEVTERYAHPDFDKMLLENDIGLVVLGGPAPDTARPSPLQIEPLDATSVGLGLRIVGFGATLDTADDAGRKRTGTTQLASLEATTFRFGAMPSQTCTGDSGGPAFYVQAGQEVLVGVTSSGDAACEEYGQDTRVDAYARDFICPLLEELGEQAAVPCPAPVDAGCCSAGGNAPAGGSALLLVAAAWAIARRRRPCVVG